MAMASASPTLSGGSCRGKHTLFGNTTDHALSVATLGATGPTDWHSSHPAQRPAGQSVGVMPGLLLSPAEGRVRNSSDRLNIQCRDSRVSLNNGPAPLRTKVSNGQFSVNLCSIITKKYFLAVIQL